VTARLRGAATACSDAAARRGPRAGEDGAAFSKPRQRAPPPHLRRAGETRTRAAAKTTSSAADAPVHVRGSLADTAWPLSPSCASTRLRVRLLADSAAGPSGAKKARRERLKVTGPKAESEHLYSAYSRRGSNGPSCTTANAP